MERQPLRKLGEIPEAERVDMSESPVTAEEMRVAVDALNNKATERPRREKKEIKHLSTEPTREASDEDTQEVIRALHTENPEQDSQ